MKLEMPNIQMPNLPILKGKQASPQKQNAKNAVCVAVDTSHEIFEFYKMDAWDKSTVTRSDKKYHTRLFSAEFFTELTEAVKSFASSVGNIEETYITLMLPDNAVAMNTVSVPNMSRRRNEEAVANVIDGMFKKREELNIQWALGSQTKQVSTYSVTVMNDLLLRSALNAMTEGGLPADAVTFSSNGFVNGASVLCPAVKSSSYLLLDIKHHSARFAFVAKGRTTGFYSLPFGYSILKKSRVYSEDMLFDHSVAELAVLNAMEKAKSKQLTMMRSENVDEGSSDEEKLDAMLGEEEGTTLDPTASPVVVQTIKELPKKTPRKLPKFMLRPQPHTDEEYGYENFRYFIKWTLNLLQSNDKLVMQGKPEKVLVNMPSDLAYLFEMTNAEQSENGIEFAPLEIQDAPEEIAEHLELFGGLYAGQYNPSNNFRS